MGRRGGAGGGGAKERKRDLELFRKSDGVMKRFGCEKKGYERKGKDRKKTKDRKRCNKFLDQEVEETKRDFEDGKTVVRHKLEKNRKRERRKTDKCKNCWRNDNKIFTDERQM